ncbi:hypothetical protein Tsubulata_013035 [Turnera subulata]|uniref:Protein kinase domain-containing protein n=1 Tax=Turnera subulata TaxID=218843 RepID=A0A9Q0G979_9ROSI|nr:hypothetical protein Tsubulata_013035 [Turnera subulata]
MAQQIKAQAPVPAFEYELFEGDPDHLRTVVATPPQPTPWIEPAELKLKHRIGRGIFGDVWLATHHQIGVDFEEHHEVAVKILHPLDKDLTQKFVEKFEGLFLKCREMQGVCWLHGVSILNGKVCIAMKFYEGSIAERIAQVKRGKFQLADALRYGIDLAKGIKELHAIGLLILNLKPSNFLLNEHDRLILGDFGIPYLLLGIPLSSPDMVLRLGTPNYMAPEQWEPDVRGPISFETDSWGFGCSILEMLTGLPPWFGKSIEEMHESVVLKEEKPEIPSGLPLAVEHVIRGCFEYDLRNRPLMQDILHAFESTLNAVKSDGGWVGPEGKVLAGKSSGSGYTEWYLSKDHLLVGDTVRSRKPLNGHKPQTMEVPEGTVASLESDTEKNGSVLVNVTGRNYTIRVNQSKLERVTSGFAAGDWVKLKEENPKHAAVGILHSVQRDGVAKVGFIGLETLWVGNSSELQIAQAYYVGQFVRVKPDVSTPRFEWPCKRRGGWSTGRISQVLPNGCLVVGFPGRLVIGDEPRKSLADPAEVGRVSFDTCPGVVEKYQHVEDFHWAVRPLAITLGLFTGIKVSTCVGRRIGAKLKKGRRSSDGQDGQAGANAAWLPPPVANILFKEGASTATVR